MPTNYNMDWVYRNCKFAAAPGLQSQPQDPEIELQHEMRVNLDKIFQRLDEDILAFKELLQYSQDPRYPNFSQAYMQAFGDKKVDDVFAALEAMNRFLAILGKNPKFQDKPVSTWVTEPSAPAQVVQPQSAPPAP